MIFLYKDPKGKSLSVTHSQTGSVKVASKAPPQSDKSVIDLEKKVASLERAMQDGERTIAELRQRISVLTKEKESMEVQKNRYNLLLYIYHDSIVMQKENHNVMSKEMENHSTMV